MRALILWLLFFIPGTTFSQHHHFVYIQGENQQAFYVRKSGETLSSSSTGFIILPKLQAGDHQFVIGFPSKQWPEFEFRVEVKSFDRGFSLKKKQDDSWEMLDLQTGEVIPGKKLADVKKESSASEFYQKSNDPFSIILASAVGDEGIRDTRLFAMATSRPVTGSVAAARPEPAKEMQQPAPEVQPPVAVNKQASGPPSSRTETTPPPAGGKPSTAGTVTPPPAVAKDKPSTASTVPPPPVATTDKPSTASTVSPPPAAAVTSGTAAKEKLSVTEQEKKLPDDPAGVKVRVDPTAAAGEKLAKPAEQGVAAKAGAAGAKPVDKPKQNTYPLYKQISKISETRGWTSTELIYVDVQGSVRDTIVIIIEAEDEPKAVRKDTIVQEIILDEKPTSITKFAPGTRTDCRGLASDRDMNNLRRKATRLTDEEEMLNVLVRDLREKCYTTERLQSLAYVFVNDKMRFDLLSQAYPYIYDPANYYKLQTLLNSEEYLTKFRALINSK